MNPLAARAHTSNLLALVAPNFTAECIYSKSWLPASVARPGSSGAGGASATTGPVLTPAHATSSDDAKLIFGTVFSLRNMARKLGGDDDAFISYRTGQYKLHFYETPANLRFVLLTDTASASMRNVLHQIYINLWVEYGQSMPRVRHVGSQIRELVALTRNCGVVVKNPLAPVEHKGGDGVQNELFELGLDQFIRGLM